MHIRTLFRRPSLTWNRQRILRESKFVGPCVKYFHTCIRNFTLRLRPFKLPFDWCLFSALTTINKCSTMSESATRYSQKLCAPPPCAEVPRSIRHQTTIVVCFRDISRRKHHTDVSSKDERPSVFRFFPICTARAATIWPRNIMKMYL